MRLIWLVLLGGSLVHGVTVKADCQPHAAHRQSGKVVAGTDLSTYDTTERALCKVPGR